MPSEIASPSEAERATASERQTQVTDKQHPESEPFRSAAAAEPYPAFQSTGAAETVATINPDQLPETTPGPVRTTLIANSSADQEPDLSPGAKSTTVEHHSPIAQLVAEHLQRMTKPRMDQRKLARLLKAIIDQVMLTEGLARPITSGARDQLAEFAATRVLRRPLKASELPRLLIDAASRLPEVSRRIETQVPVPSNQRHDRIDAKQIREARKSGVLAGVDPWG